MELTQSPLVSLGLAMRAKAIDRKSPGDGDQWLAAARAPVMAHKMLAAKAAVGTGSNDIDLGGYGGASIGAWAETLKNRSAFMRILADNAFIRARLNSRVAITTQPAIGYVVGEGAAMPLSPIAIRHITLQPVRCMSLVVCSNEQLTDLSTAAQIALSRTIGDAVAQSIDSAFIDAIISTGTPSFPASGTSAIDAWADLRQALLAVSSSGAGSIYAIASPEVGAMLATLSTTGGAQVFSAAPNEVANYPLVISDGAPASEIIVVNATQIAVDATPVVPVGTTQSSIEMSDTPIHNSTTPTPTSLISLWQTNATGLGAQSYIGAEALNDAAVAVITGVDYGGA